jgi:hypothetical protein
VEVVGDVIAGQPQRHEHLVAVAGTGPRPRS